jgi:hypothetical protein
MDDASDSSVGKSEVCNLYDQYTSRARVGTDTFHVTSSLSSALRPVLLGLEDDQRAAMTVIEVGDNYVVIRKKRVK